MKSSKSSPSTPLKDGRNTSFTALSRFIDHASVDTVVNAEDRQDDDILLSAQMFIALSPIVEAGESSNEVNSIRFNFERHKPRYFFYIVF